MATEPTNSLRYNVTVRIVIQHELPFDKNINHTVLETFNVEAKDLLTALHTISKKLFDTPTLKFEIIGATRFDVAQETVIWKVMAERQASYDNAMSTKANLIADRKFVHNTPAYQGQTANNKHLASLAYQEALSKYDFNRSQDVQEQNPQERNPQEQAHV